MIKSELADLLANRHPHLYSVHVERIVDTVLREIVETMRRGGRVELRGFGSFSVRSREARKGRNPRDGTAVDVGAKRALYFRASRELRKRLTPKA